MWMKSSFWQKEKTWGFHAFYSCYYLISAHSTDLLIDVTIAVDIILLCITHINPSEYRIINLTGVAVICAASAFRCALFRLRRGCQLFRRFRLWY